MILQPHFSASGNGKGPEWPTVTPTRSTSGKKEPTVALKSLRFIFVSGGRKPFEGKVCFGLDVLSHLFLQLLCEWAPLADSKIRIANMMPTGTSVLTEIPPDGPQTLLPYLMGMALNELLNKSVGKLAWWQSKASSASVVFISNGQEIGLGSTENIFKGLGVSLVQRQQFVTFLLRPFFLKLG